MTNGDTRRDRMQNYIIRKMEVVEASTKAQKTQLHWYRHVMGREQEARGKPKKQWRDFIGKDEEGRTK